MKLRFTKMHGLGNDFVMIDAISQTVDITSDIARKLAHRQLGIGCDQVLIVEAPEAPDADFKYRIFNQDGAEVENCGNGARCFAMFVRMRKLTGKRRIKAQTACGILELVVERDERVKVDMGRPILAPQAIPFDTHAQDTSYTILLGNDGARTISAISMGNPHAIMIVDDVASYPVASEGPLLESHAAFPNNCNAGFMEIVSREVINLRVYERGVGETLACGTGACAAVVAGILQGLLETNVTVNLPGGALSIGWENEQAPVIMTGPTSCVFHGQVTI